MTTYRKKQIHEAEKKVNDCLNYGGIVIDGVAGHPHRLHIDCERGALNDEIAHIRLFASALFQLAEALEPLREQVFPPSQKRSLDQFASVYGSDKGTTYFHRHSYTRVYEQLFSVLRDQPIALLEIGMNIDSQSNGEPNWYTPSLYVWRNYFPLAKLYGIDIASYRPSPIKDCVLIQADQSDAAELDRATAGLSFDVVIDDGSHISAHQQTALATLFPKVRPGGYYIIEDLHFQPSLDTRQTCKTQELLLMLQRKCALPPKHMLAPSAVAYLEKTIDQIMFFDSLSPDFPVIQTVDALCVIRKKPLTEARRARGKKTGKTAVRSRS